MEYTTTISFYKRNKAREILNKQRSLEHAIGHRKNLEYLDSTLKKRKQIHFKKKKLTA